MVTGDSGTKANNAGKLGGTLSVLAGIVFLASALAFFLLPPEQMEFTARSEFFTSVAANPTVLKITFWGSMIGALLAIATVVTVESYMRSVDGVGMRWSSRLAIVAYAISAVGNANDLIQIPQLAARYVEADSLTRTAIEAIGLSRLDPSLLLHSLLLGIWFLVVNSLALRNGALPKSLSCTGLVFGIGSLLYLPFFLLNLQFLVLVVMVLGLVVISPIWFIGVGFVLRRT